MTTLVPVIAALAGAVVGAMSAEVRSFLELRRENRKVLNKVLFNLLDLRHALRVTDPAVVLEFITEGMADHFGAAAAEAEISSALTASPGLTHILASTTGAWTPADLAKQYDAAVESLSAVDPLLAFQLSGRPGLLQKREEMNKLMDLLTPEQAPEGAAELRSVHQAVKDTVHSILHRSALELLEEDILDVAARLGWVIRWRARRILTRTEDGLREERAAHFAELFGQIEAVLKEHQHPSSPSAP